MTEYHIIGFAGNEDAILHETYTFKQARQWVADYTRTCWGGWDGIRIDAFGEDMNEPVEYFYPPEQED